MTDWTRHVVLITSGVGKRHGSGFVRGVFICVVTVLIAKTAWDGYSGAG